MDDLVERLRMAYRLEDDTDDLREEAAAEITRLREENKSLNDECNKSMTEIENLRRDIETARREALEEAWKVADAAADTAVKQSGQGHALDWCAYRMAQAQEIANTIRALIQPNTSPS